MSEKQWSLSVEHDQTRLLVLLVGTGQYEIQRTRHQSAKRWWCHLLDMPNADGVSRVIMDLSPTRTEEAIRWLTPLRSGVNARREQYEAYGAPIKFDEPKEANSHE